MAIETNSAFKKAAISFAASGVGCTRLFGGSGVEDVRAKLPTSDQSTHSIIQPENASGSIPW